MKTLHLIPINVIDIVEKLNVEGIRESEVANYIARLEAIRDYCDTAIKKANQKRFVVPSRKKNNTR